MAPNQRELRRRIAAKMTDKICVIGDKEPNTVVESVSETVDVRWTVGVAAFRVGVGQQQNKSCKLSLIGVSQ